MTAGTIKNDWLFFGRPFALVFNKLLAGGLSGELQKGMAVLSKNEVHFGFQ